MGIEFNDKYDEILRRKYDKYGRRISQHLWRKENQYLVDYVNAATPLLADPKYTLSTKIYWVLNHITDFPECANERCRSKLTKNVTIKDGYVQKYCSYKCLNSSSDKKAKVKRTCLDRYGVENPFQNDEIKKIIHDKTCAGEKLRGRLEKTRRTCLQKYGVPAYFQSSDIKEKTVKKLGADNVFKTEKFKKDATAKRRGQFYDGVLLNDSDVVPMFSKTDYQKSGNRIPYLWKCKRCGGVFSAMINENWFRSAGRASHIRCLKCNPYLDNGTSAMEDRLCEFISGLKFDLLRNSRKVIAPLELDIYVPEKKLAFEFDGLYWHSDENKPNDYHLLKTEACEKLGIRLVHIFENEWKLKDGIVKSRIKNLFGVHDRTVFARKCDVKELDSKTSKLFQDENHIQGAVNASVNLGLYFKDELVSLMTFSKCRFDKKREWEMLRFCNKLGYHVPGGAGKLLKYFERSYNPKSIVSYADRRWSQGGLYKALGFRLDHVSKPDYWYFDKHKEILFSRVKFQKHKLKDVLENFDSSKTEVENMKANGYLRIFDCGNMVFEKTY